MASTDRDCMACKAKITPSGPLPKKMLPILDPQNHTKAHNASFWKMTTRLRSLQSTSVLPQELYFYSFSDWLLTLILKSTLSVSVFLGKDKQQHIMILENWNRNKHLLPSERVPKNSSLEQLKGKHLPWLSWIRMPEGLCKLPSVNSRAVNVAYHIQIHLLCVALNYRGKCSYTLFAQGPE